MEKWKPVKEFPEYEVSSLGRIRRVTPNAQGRGVGKIMSPFFVRGYPNVGLGPKGKRKTYR